MKTNKSLANKFLYIKEKIMGDNSEKRKAIDAAMGQIEQQFGNGSVMILGEFKS